MGLLSGFSNRDVDEFAKSLAEDIAKRLPPAMENKPEKKLSANRITKILEDAFVKAQKFRGERRLGVYRKARLSNTFRWQLKDLGYSDQFIDLATEGLIVYITRKGEPRTKE
jgi:hypothetical protein